LVHQIHPDLVLTDLPMPGMNGMDAILRILAENPKPKVVCLSVHGIPRLVTAVMDLGVSAYLVKGCAYQELILALRSVMANKRYLSEALSGVVSLDSPPIGSPAGAPAHAQLTVREREVVQLYSEGQNTHQIAERLHISEKTVSTHREHVMAKLGITGIAELTRYAIREEICSVCAPCPGTTPNCEAGLHPHCRSGDNSF